VSDPRWVRHYPPGVPARIERHDFASLPDLIRQSAATWGARPAYTACAPDGATASLTFEAVDRHSDAFAVYLRRTLKLARGDRVAIQAPNGLAYPIVAFGVFKAGCVLVNTNPLYTAAEMTHQFNDSGARALVAADACYERLVEVLPKTSIERVVTTSANDFFPGGGPRFSPFPSHALREAIELGRGGEEARGYAAELGDADTAVLQYTGGTTGVSKGAMLTHGNLLWQVTTSHAFSAGQSVPGEEVVLTVLPMYHIFAFSVNLLGYFRDGWHNILIAVGRPLSNLRAAFEKFDITWMTGVNTLYAGLLKEPWFRERPPRSMKAAIGGGAAMHQAVVEEWKAVVGSLIYEGYGLTETSPTMTFNPIGGLYKIGSIGIPLPNWEVRVLKDDGTEAAMGEPGEIVARGPQVMRGYWNRPDETAKVLSDGWLRTGDVAVMDEDGYLRIVDRKKDMILVSGFNVYPNEVEDCIAKLAGVTEVAVIGVPHEVSGEVVKAFVVAPGVALTADQVREHCRKTLTGYKIPKLVEFRRELPKSAVGKILRRELRAEELRNVGR
jgi:long-chain acyl-CoA synthetase